MDDATPQGRLFEGGSHPGTTLRPSRTGHQAIDTRNAAYSQVMREEQGDVLHADALTDDLGERQTTVYKALLERGPHGATNAELAEVLGWPVNRITPRVYELRGEGRDNPLADDPLVVPLRDNGRSGSRVKREGASGAAGQVWVAVAVLASEQEAHASPKNADNDDTKDDTHGCACTRLRRACRPDRTACALICRTDLYPTMKRVTHKELMAYAKRLRDSLDAKGITIAIRSDDDIRVVTTEEEARQLRRLQTRVDVLAGRQEVIDEVQSLINPTDTDE